MSFLVSAVIGDSVCRHLIEVVSPCVVDGSAVFLIGCVLISAKSWYVEQQSRIIMTPQIIVTPVDHVVTFQKIL